MFHVLLKICVRPLLEITSKSRQNQDTCLGTSRQWVQQKIIYFSAKKQQISLGFSWFCLDFKVIFRSGGSGHGGNAKGSGGSGWGGTHECAVEILYHIHVRDFITYPWTPRTHSLDFVWNFESQKIETMSKLPKKVKNADWKGTA